MEDTFDGLSEDELLRIGYQQPCKGDSGSGNWMNNLQSGRKALVAHANNMLEPLRRVSRMLLAHWLHKSNSF